MTYGTKSTGAGPLIYKPTQYSKLITRRPILEKYSKFYVGAEEFIDGDFRYCLWFNDDDVPEVNGIPEVQNAFEQIRQNRLKSPKMSTQRLAETPHKFGEIRYRPTDSIIVPSVSSERREYIPMGYLSPDTVISNAAFAIYDAKPWLFALLTSQMHMAWARAVGGKMKTDYRYSNTIVYNNFPVPDLSDRQKQRLTELALRVLDVREYHCDKTLAQLYDPDLMPDNLRQAHREVDEYVDSLYSKRTYETDEDRLSDLFARYEEMIAAEEAAKPKKKTRKRKK